MTEWELDCIRWQGRVLTGAQAHWCPDWDYLPIDETTPEHEACTCGPVVQTTPIHDAP